MQIITNNVPRDVIEAYELTQDERAEFDYLDWNAIELGEDSASFFRYKGSLYDLGDFTSTSAFAFLRDSALTAFTKWDGYASDTYFSGVLVRYVNERDQVIVGRYYS